MSELNFEITADNSNFLNAIHEVQDGMRRTTETIEQVGKNFDVSTMEGKIIALNKVIGQNEEVILQCRDTINRWSKDAQAAFDSGDMGTFNAINKDIDEQIHKIQELKEETDGYKAALETLHMMSDTGGLTSKKTSAPMLFNTEEEYKQMKQLAAGIDELRVKIATFDGSEAELHGLKSQLSGLQDELRKCEMNAAEAAAKLGEDGQKAAAASVRFFELSSALERQTGIVGELTNKLNAAATALDEAKASGDATAIEDASIKYDLLAESLQNAKLELINITSAHEDAKNAFQGDATQSIRMQLRQLTMEIAELTLNYRALSDEEKKSEVGQGMLTKLHELTEKAGDLRDAMDDVNRAINATASDTKNFDALAGGLNIVSSSFGAVTGAAAMLGIEEENLQDIQTKLQASLAISNALSVIQNNLQKESALMVGVRTVQEKAAAAAIAIRTAAEGKGVIATKAATVAQAAFNLVAKANPYVLLATAIITVVGALAAFTIGSKKATEAEKKQAEEAQKLKEKQEEMNKALGTSTGNLEAKYRSLQQQWKRLRNEAEKNKWIKDNADAFKNLGLKVQSVSDAEKVLVKLAPQVIAALKAVAEAEAYSDLYKQSIVKRATEWEHRVKGTATGDTYKPVTKGEKIQSSVSTPQEWIDAGLTYGTDYSTSIIQNSLLQAYTLTKAGVDKINKYRNDQAVALRKKLEAGYNEEVDFYASKWEEAEQRAIAAKSKIPSSLLDNGGNGSGGNDKPVPDRSKMFEEQMKQEREQARRLQELEFSTRQAEIDIMQDGTEKSLNQIQLDHDQKLAAIQSSYEDLIQKRVDEAKKLWELDPKNKDKDFYKSDEFSAASQATEQEVNNFRAQIAAANAMYVRAISDLEVPGIPASFIEERIESIKSAYTKAVQAIQEQEAQLKESQGGMLTNEQSEAFLQEYADAQKKMENEVKLLEQAEVERAKKKYNSLLSEYQSYDQKRRKLDEDYQKDMAVYNDQRKKIVASGGSTTDLDASMSERTKQYQKEVKELQSDILEASDFYTKLFGDVSKRGYKILRDFYKQAKETLDNAKVLADGVEIDILSKDSDGNFAKKTVKVTVEEFEKMKDRLHDILGEVEKDNPFAAFESGWNDLMDAMKNDGDVAGGLKNLNAKGKELTSTIKGWGDSLGAVFGKNFSQSIDEMMQMVDGVMDMGTGIAQIYSGDIVGGITNTLSGLSSIVSLFTSWKEKMEEMKRQWYIAEIETSRELRKQREEYEGMRSTISDIISGTETLNWLIAHGFAKPNRVSLWEAESAKLEEYKKNLDAESKAYDELWGKLQGSTGYYEWGNSLNGGSMEWSLRGYSAEQIQLWYNQDKLSGAARDYYEAWVDSGKSVQELVQHIEECHAAMQEMVMGTTFDNFLSSVKDCLYEARGDVQKFADFAEDTIAEGLLNAFMYKQLANMMEPLFNELSAALVDGTANKDYLTNWKERFNNELAKATELMNQISKDTGIDIFSRSDDKEAKEYFDDLRDMWLSTLTNMEDDAKSWSLEITRIMVEDLINSLVLNEDFNEWLTDWKNRYKEVMSIDDEAERERRLLALREEQLRKREELAQKSKGIMDDMGYTEMMKDLEKSDSAFDDLHSQFLETLMDMNADAEEWSKKITETMVKQLIEKNLLNDAFDNKLDDWKKRFEAIMADTTLSDTEREASLAALRAELESMRESLSAEAQKYLDSLGYSEMIAEKPVSPFKDLRTQFVNTLMDMQGDAESFRKNLQKTLTQSLIEKFVLNDDFDEYLENWNERYMAILNDGNKSQEEIEAALDAMIEELVAKRELTLEQAEKLRERLKEEDTTFADMKDNWSSALLDMTSDAKSFAENVRQIFAEKIINQFLLGSSFEKFLDRYQDAVNAIMDGEGTMDDKIAALLPMIDDWVAKYEELAPLAERIREAFGIVPNEFADAFGDLRSTFVSALMDMESDADSFAQNISKIMSQAFIDKFVLGKAFDQQIELWQERYASIVNSEITEEERARQLKELADAIAAAKEGYTEQAKAIQDLFGLTVYEDQEATMNTVDKATYDQFETWLGIAVAQQMATLQGNEVRLQILATLQAMSGITTPGSDTVKEIRAMLNTTNEYLLAIKKATENIYNQFGAKLDMMNSKLTGLI